MFLVQKDTNKRYVLKFSKVLAGGSGKRVFRSKMLKFYFLGMSKYNNMAAGYIFLIIRKKEEERSKTIGSEMKSYGLTTLYSFTLPF